MILEAIVTTKNRDGSTNVAPMGPHCLDSDLTTFELRPFQSSRTFANLKQHGQGVLHVTDDVLLFATLAIGKKVNTDDLQASTAVDVPTLANCCRRYEFEMTWLNDADQRATIHCRTRHSDRIRDFFGFNRAKHAVLEACILATRIDFLPLAEIEQQLSILKRPVEKTGSESERLAFQLIENFVACPNPLSVTATSLSKSSQSLTDK